MDASEIAFKEMLQPEAIVTKKTLEEPVEKTKAVEEVEDVVVESTIEEVPEVEAETVPLEEPEEKSNEVDMGWLFIYFFMLLVTRQKMVAKWLQK